MVYVAHFVSCVVVLALLPSILDIYGLSETATMLTTKIIWYHGILAVIIWPLAYSLPVTFRASNDARFPMTVGTLSMVFCRIALGYVLSIYADMGMFGTWVAMFIDWFVKAGIFVYRYMAGSWIKYKTV